jgi:hypothetical protein
LMDLAIFLPFLFIFKPVTQHNDTQYDKLFQYSA